MRTILVTGGANGLGKGIALHYLAKGEKVVAVGNSAMNGATFCNDAKQIGAAERAVFIHADLSLTERNRQLVEEISKKIATIDALVLCASKHRKNYFETAEGFESSFALDYLSRFILGYGLKECLEKAAQPVIVNVCGVGMKGSVNWDDLQHKSYFNPMKVMMHGSRLNELSAIAFAHNDEIKKIKYVLYNPMAVRTPGMVEFGNAAMKLYYKLAAKPVDKAIVPIADLLDNPPEPSISAYKERKGIPLDSPALSIEKAVKLYEITLQLLENVGTDNEKEKAVIN